MRFATVIAPALAMASVVLSISPAVRADDSRAPLPSHAAVAAPSDEVSEARAQIDATFAEMRATSIRVRDQLRLARRRGTKPQITCVDEALSRSDVALRRARELGDEILGAYARGDLGSAHAARGRLVELRESLRFATAQARKCTPRPVLIAALSMPSGSATTVKVDVDPRIPRID